MRPGRPLWIATRLLVVAGCGITASYALVASSAFAYRLVLQPRMVPPLNWFATWHSGIAWLWLALLTAHVWPDRRRGRAERWLVDVLVATGAGWAVWNTVRPVLPALADSWPSVAVAVLACLPAVGLAALDHCRSTPLFWRSRQGLRRAWPDLDSHLFRACAVTGLGLTLLYVVLAAVRLQRAFEPELLAAAIASAAFWSLLTHAVVFGGVFLGLAVTSRVGGRSLVGQHVAVTATILGGFVLVFDRVFTSSLGLSGPRCLAAATAVAALVVGTWSGVSLTRLCSRGARVDHGVEIYLGTPSREPGRRGHSWLLFVCLGGIAWGLTLVAAIVDWDHLLLDHGVLAVWTVGFACVYRRTSNGPIVGLPWLSVACLFPLMARLAIVPSAGAERMLSRYQVYDPSFRVADRLQRRPVQTPTFTTYLRANTGLTDLSLDPVNVSLVDDLGPADAPPPIFVVVVDSLRHDYLQPYNGQVSFTPRVAEFARDSIVFTNAFTRYGGTGLSIPALWAGSALPHKQHVRPFHPMNALEKLVEVNDYVRYVQIDPMMRPLLRVTPRVRELTEGVEVLDHELCRTAEELVARLGGARGERRVFAYLRPVDVHMGRASKRVTAPHEFPGFSAPYASRVQTVDGCFGSFVDGLRRLGLYDQSLIILTSDHGEMLGEDGQHGHSYHLFPPVVRVPLIVHLPVGRAHAVDPDGVSFTTDITPTIYAALGYRPTAVNPLVGRPLIGQEAGEQRSRRRGTYVLAASYGAVYAVVSRNGRRLYIADAVKETDYAFERSPTGEWASRPTSPDLRAVAQFAIRRHIEEVRRVYHVPRRD